MTFFKSHLKDIIIAVLLISFFVCFFAFSDIQSVDDYYLDHPEKISKDSKTVSLSIDCSSVFDNYGNLDSSLKNGNFLPENGIILAEKQCLLHENDSVFDLLCRAVKHDKIQLDYSGNKSGVMINAYIKGISNLYEFSCGENSGWIYLVNGQAPSVSCSNYYPKDNDKIEWIYVCSLKQYLSLQKTKSGGIK